MYILFICAHVCTLAWEVISPDVRDCNSYSYPNKPYKLNTDFFVIKKEMYLCSLKAFLYLLLITLPSFVLCVSVVRTTLRTLCLQV